MDFRNYLNEDQQVLEDEDIDELKYYLEFNDIELVSRDSIRIIDKRKYVFLVYFVEIGEEMEIRVDPRDNFKITWFGFHKQSLDGWSKPKNDVDKLIKFFNKLKKMCK